MKPSSPLSVGALLSTKPYTMHLCAHEASLPLTVTQRQMTLFLFQTLSWVPIREQKFQVIRTVLY